jgi:hypothetical protein
LKCDARIYGTDPQNSFGINLHPCSSRTATEVPVPTSVSAVAAVPAIATIATIASVTLA